jgi:arylsulfatase A-like enzyme
VVQTPNLDRLAAGGTSFRRHFANAVPCAPSRASIYTGQYPSLHGATQTTGAAKESFDPDVFWLDPNSVPTFGDYFRAAGYSTFWRGKWHASDADMLVPGTHDQLVSYNANGVPNPAQESLYQSSDRLDSHGFSGWIGPEPHGSAPLNSGSSVPFPQQGRDIGFAQQARKLIQQLDHDKSNTPWFIVSSFVNPHDIMYFSTDAPEKPVQDSGRLLFKAAPAPLHESYAAKWDVPIPESLTQPFDAPGRPPAHGEYQRGWDVLLGQIPPEEERWRRFNDFYVNSISAVFTTSA